MSDIRRALTDENHEQIGYVDYAIDCRSFADPEYSKDSFKHHLGSHPSIQMGVVQNVIFIEHVRYFQSVLALALVCNSGWHRSVAVCDLLAYSLRDYGFYTTVVHRSSLIRGGWSRNLCQGYDVCPDCRWSDEHRAMAEFASGIFKACLGPVYAWF